MLDNILVMTWWKEGSGRTFWAHKAKVWENLFKTVHNFAKKEQCDPISDMFNGVLSCPVRAIPNGPNKTKTFVSVKGQKIQHWILLVPMPADVDFTGYVKEFVSWFHQLCKKPYVRSAYKSGVEAISTYPGKIDAISEDGNYWIVIDTTAQKDFTIQSNFCLSEVLQDYTIKEDVSLMFGLNKDFNLRSESVKTYAFRN